MRGKGVRLSADELFDYTRRQYSSPSTHSTRYIGERRGSGRGKASRNNTHVRPRSREQFVCANYAFGVSPDAIVSVEDPDMPVDWNNVDVVFESSKPEDCPICLHPLRAARTTRCGHIFDLVCALQHIHHTPEGRDTKCPLCSAKMDISDLRAVTFRCHRPPSVGSSVNGLTLQLVARPRYSIIPRVFDSSDIVDDFAHIPSDVTASTCFFARLVIVDTDFLLDLIATAIADLDRILREDPSLKPFVDTAKSINRSQRDQIKSRRGKTRGPDQVNRPSNSQCYSLALHKKASFRPMSVVEHPVETSLPSSSTHADDESPFRAFESTLSNVSAQSDGPWITDGDRGAGPSRSSFAKHGVKREERSSNAQRRIRQDPDSASYWPRPDQNAFGSSSVYVFYQSSNGQNVFLHPFCHRIISADVKGDFSAAKAIFNARAVDVHHHTMDEVLRRRYRFLGHLPLGCEFSFVEIDPSQVVSQETLQAFSSELSDRASHRKQREIASERDSRRIARMESDSLRKYFEITRERVALSRQNETVDSSDMTSFPPIYPAELLTDAMSSSANNDAPSDVSSSAANEVSADRGSQNLSTSPQNWGESVSSYSAATANMGVFPSLNATVTYTNRTGRDAYQESVSRSSPIAMPFVGRSTNVSMSRSEGRESSPSDSAWSQSPRRATWSLPSRDTEPGVQASTMSSNERHQSSSHEPSQPRRTRRHNGRNTITLLSNAGTQNQR